MSEPNDSLPPSLDRLRELLVKPEQGRIEAVEEQLAEPVDAQSVAEVLPKAISHRGTDDEALSLALTPTIERGLEESVKRNPKVLADAVFPIIGPAIRRSIAQTMSEFVESINRTVEYSLTLKGLSWRIEAWRTGRPLAEIVLAKSFRYRVEQVFLVHRETGLLLAHVVADGAPQWEPDLVSSMLGAIQDFMSDSFGGEGQDVQLEQIDIASGLLILSPGPDATVAGWVRGTPPPTVREALVEACERVHQELAPEFTQFDGDTEPFTFSRPVLGECISEQATEEGARRKQQSKSSWVTWLLLWLAVVGIVLILINRHAVRSQREDDREALRANLEAAPGISVQSVEGDDPIVLDLWVDPRAKDPRKIVDGLTLKRSAAIEITTRPYLSADPEILLKRLADRLPPKPDPLTWRVQGETLYLKGRVPASFLALIEQRLPFVEGLSQVDTSAVEVVENQ